MAETVIFTIRQLIKYGDSRSWARLSKEDALADFRYFSDMPPVPVSEEIAVTSALHGVYHTLSRLSEQERGQLSTLDQDQAYALIKHIWEQKKR